MSKGNLLLGYGRGKVGDIVLTRGEGQQITRARNRNPRNPKTEKQMYQRAVMATVMQMYKAGQAIFDHSIQGKPVGLANMKRFLQINAKKLRANIISDIAGSTTTCTVVSPGAVTPVPGKYRIAEGTFTPSLIQPTNDTTKVDFSMAFPSGAKLADVLVPGDIHTIVAMYITGTTATTDKISPASVFAFLRLEVKQTLPDITVATAKLSEAFEIEGYNVTVNPNMVLGDAILSSALLGFDAIAAGVIHSRQDSGLRSTTDMVCVAPSWGIIPANISEAWNAAVTNLGNSNLILEGGEGQ